jgi:hypothetical protein
MKLCPDIPARRKATVTRDLLVLDILVLFAWLGWKVYETVDRLSVLGEGVENSGSSIQNRFQSAADAVNRVPAVRDDLAHGLTSGGQSTGGNLAQLGQDGQVMFVVAVGSLLLTVGPLRWRQVRRLTRRTASSSIRPIATDASLISAAREARRCEVVGTLGARGRWRARSAQPRPRSAGPLATEGCGHL